jgi:hypothetical protein
VSIVERRSAMKPSQGRKALRALVIMLVAAALIATMLLASGC